MFHVVTVLYHMFRVSGSPRGKEPTNNSTISVYHSAAADKRSLFTELHLMTIFPCQSQKGGTALQSYDKQKRNQAAG